MLFWLRFNKQQKQSIKNNLCQGSDYHGFALPFVPCSYLNQTPYSNNTVGSALKAYACQIGQISNPPDTRRLVFKNFMFADSQQAVGLRFGKDGDDRTAYLSDSYILAISSPGFTQCYGANATDCTHNYAVNMLAVTEINQELLLLNPAFLGWFGGCGDLLCTGANKFLIHDHTGSLLGQPSILLANYSEIVQCLSSRFGKRPVLYSNFALVERSNFGFWHLY